MPFFSVIIPTYNRAEHLKKTIDSVLKQEFEDWELIIVDDGSTDNTKEVVEFFADNRIRYVYQENQERGKARNNGAKLASGKFLNFFDSDDVMKPIHLTSAMKYLTDHPQTEVVCFPWEYYSESGEKRGQRNYDNDLNKIVLRKNYIHLNGGFIRSDVFQQNPFEEDREFNICEDWYFYMKLSLNHQIDSQNTPTFNYNLHSGSTMSNMSSTAFETAIKYFTNLIEKYPLIRKHKKFIISDLYGMLSLSLAIERQRTKSLITLWKMFLTRPAAIFTKRTLGTFKNIIYAPRRS